MLTTKTTKNAAYINDLIRICVLAARFGFSKARLYLYLA